MLRTSLDRQISDVVSLKKALSKVLVRTAVSLRTEMRSFAQIVARKWLPSPSVRYAVVRASTCECARSARDVRDPTGQTRSQYRSKRFRNPGGDINDAEDSIREGQWPLRATRA
jgi:hypothetical protein